MAVPTLYRDLSPPQHLRTSLQRPVSYVEQQRDYSEQLTLAIASPARRHHGRQKVSIPEWDLTGRLEEWSTITPLSVRSHSGIDNFCLL